MSVSNTPLSQVGGAFYSSTPTYTLSDPLCDATFTITMADTSITDANIADSVPTPHTLNPEP